jgi:hypothetical protein
VHTLLIYLDQDEIVLVTLQPEFESRDINGRARRVAYVDRRLQSFPHLRTRDLPADVALLDIQPARADCRYLTIDDATLRSLRETELRRAAAQALDGASAHDALRDMKAAVAAIPAYLAAERDRLQKAASEGFGEESEAYASWSSPASLALLQETHADIAARIKAAAVVLARYSVDPTSVETADAHATNGKAGAAEAVPEPSGLWRKFYDLPRSASLA